MREIERSRARARAREGEGEGGGVAGKGGGGRCEGLEETNYHNKQRQRGRKIAISVNEMQHH